MALLNLLSNAVKYNRPQGRVEISYHSCAGGRLRIAVTDTGAGIREEELAQLFTPFERLGADQTATEGTGLGLALSKGLAEAMGGTLGVASAINRGTTFWVELAECPAPGDVDQTPNVVAASPSNVQEGSGTVLYIEDNASNVRLLERVLQRRPGITLLVANTGEAGLAIAHSRRPDLIFLDLHLPDMGGEAVLRGLLEDVDTQTIPVAVLSADAMPAQQRRLLAAGATAYLTKPLELDKLMRLVDETLSSKTAVRR